MSGIAALYGNKVGAKAQRSNVVKTPAHVLGTGIKHAPTHAPKFGQS